MNRINSDGWLRAHYNILKITTNNIVWPQDTDTAMAEAHSVYPAVVISSVRRAVHPPVRMFGDLHKNPSETHFSVFGVFPLVFQYWNSKVVFSIGNYDNKFKHRVFDWKF